MKIVSTKKIYSEIIETDANEFPTYRRNNSADWENLMGDSWEPVYCCNNLEAMYQAWRRGNEHADSTKQLSLSE